MMWRAPWSPSRWPVLPSDGGLCPWGSCWVDRGCGFHGVGLGFLPAPSSLGQSHLLWTHQWSMPLTALGRTSPPLARTASLLLPMLLPPHGTMRTLRPHAPVRGCTDLGWDDPLFFPDTLTSLSYTVRERVLHSEIHKPR